jgi:hypothetical protein
MSQFTDRYRIPISEEDLILFKGKSSDSYKFELYDDLGGTCYIKIDNGTPSIIDINSIPSGKRYTEEAKNLKRRGFFSLVISSLKILGFGNFSVKIQSGDSQRALARLFDKRVISNPRDYSGSSDSTKPSTFDIGDSGLLSDNPNDKRNYNYWIDYKKRYLQKV